MRLDRIEVRKLALPLRAPFETSAGRMHAKEFLLVSVSAEGVTGHGECVAAPEPTYLPETNDTALHVLEKSLAPRAFALEISHPRNVLPAFSAVRGHEMAKAALEMAVWDLWARRESVPLHRLLGGRGGEIAAGVSIGLEDEDDAVVDKVTAEVDAGYQRFKVKIKPGRDVGLVEAIRKRFPRIPLMVDANSAYDLQDGDRLAKLDRFDLMMIEQPLAWDDLVDHATLQERLQTALCLDESIRSPDHARHALDLGSCRIVNIKVGRVGGFEAARQVHDICQARGVPVWCGGMVESGIGRLANVHLQTLPGFTLPGDTSASARVYEEDLVDPPVEVSKAGTIRVPGGPGIGHEIVWSRVEKATGLHVVWRRP